MTDHEQYNFSVNRNTQPTLNPQGQDFKSSPNVLETSKSLIVKRTLTVNDTEVQQNLGQRWAYTTRSTTYTALLTDYVIGIASTTAAYSVNLPRAALAGIGKAFVIKDIGGSATSNNITLDPDGSELIDGQTTKVINTDYTSYTVICDGAQWYII